MEFAPRSASYPPGLSLERDCAPEFIFSGLPTRVIFGRGTLARLPEEIDRLGHSRPMVLSTPHQREAAERLAKSIHRAAAGVFSGAVMHTPVEVSERAVARVRTAEADCIIALGGGSTIGLGKAIALRTGLDQIVVPTTYAGSEMTPILGETAGATKTTQRSEAIRPEVVLYDVDLTLTLPVPLSIVSGINAIAHAAEALYAEDRNPVASMMAEEGIALLAGALPTIAINPMDSTARVEALRGAWLCATCLGMVGMAMHHKLCHTLGGSFGLPHAEVHTVVLPHVLAYNASHAPNAMARIGRALGGGEPAMMLHTLVARLGGPLSLRDLGMRESDIDLAADFATKDPYPNPRTIERKAIRALIARAWAGDAPEV